MSPINVVCINWGTKYPAYYVNRLFAGVSRHLGRPHTFHCFTDDTTGIRSEVVVHPLPAEPFEADLVAAMQHWLPRGIRIRASRGSISRKLTARRKHSAHRWRESAASSARALRTVPPCGPAGPVGVRG